MPRLRLRAHARPLAAVFLAGLATSLAFPPARLWPIAFVCLIPLLASLAGAGSRRGFWLGVVFGLGFYGSTLYWIFRFGFAAWIAATLILALSAGVFGLLYPVVRRSMSPAAAAPVAAAAWTLIDWIHASWPLGGFAWGSLGISQVDNRATVRLASVTGVWGVTFVVVLVNALLLAALTNGAGSRARVVAAAAAVVLALGPLAIAFPAATGRVLRVASIQVDVRLARSAPNGVAEDLQVAQLNIAEHERLTSAPRPDLIVWGEGALDPGAASDVATMNSVRSVIASVGAPTLVGAVTDDPDGRERTDVLLFDGGGQLVDRYDKVHLVPFGEYVPWRAELSWFRALQQIPVDRAPGERIHSVRVAGLPPFGSPICFENNYPQIPRQMVRDGAGFLVVTVNNASYGTTAASAQHEQMSRMRAVEDGRWIVDAAVSGISAFIDPSGRVTEDLGLFRTGILQGSIRSSDHQTLYVRLGDWVPWLCLAFLATLLAMPRRRAGRLPAPDALPQGFRTLVVLPTYNEGATIQRVLDGVLSAPQAPDVLVVDDSSPDGTGKLVAERAANLGSRLQLLERPAKSGLGSAYLEGFRRGLEGGYELIVEMDSDMSHDPAELPALLAATATRDHLTIGSRYVPGGSVTNWSRARLTLSKAGNIYVRAMLGVPFHDATSGFRVYRADLLRVLVSMPLHADGYGFQIELAMRAWRLGYTVGELPITFREREHGVSKISRRIVLEALWLVTRWGVIGRLTGRFGT